MPGIVFVTLSDLKKIWIFLSVDYNSKIIQIIHVRWDNCKRGQKMPFPTVHNVPAHIFTGHHPYFS